MEEKKLVLSHVGKRLTCEIVSDEFNESHFFLGDVPHFDEAVTNFENVIQYLCFDTFGQSLNKENLVHARLLGTAAESGIQFLVHHLGCLSAELNEGIDHLPLLLHFSLLCIGGVPLSSYFQNRIIESALNLRDQVRLFL